MNNVASGLMNGALLSAFLTAVVWLVLRTAPRRFLNAATRHIVWWIVLAIMIALPANCRFNHCALQNRPHKHFIQFL